MLCGGLAVGLAGLMLASGFLWSIDTDKTDGNLLAIGNDGDRVAVGDPGAFVLGGMKRDVNNCSQITVLKR